MGAPSPWATRLRPVLCGIAGCGSLPPTVLLFARLTGADSLRYGGIGGGTTGKRWPVAVSPQGARVPDKFAAAIVAFEDRRFYRHPGVDPLALARVLRNAVRARRLSGGASTLPMQVVRLSRGNPRRTVGEKCLEIMFTLRLSLHRSKGDILSPLRGPLRGKRGGFGSRGVAVFRPASPNDCPGPRRAPWRFYPIARP